MKCSRCGEEYSKNQTFCLKCGTPIQDIPDFNIIESELADNVGRLMESVKNESFDTEDDDLDYLDDEYYDNYMPKHEVEADLELVDLGGFTGNLNTVGFDVDSSDRTREYSDVNPDYLQKNDAQESKSNAEKEIQKEKKDFKVKAILFTILAIGVIAGAITLLKVYNHKNSSSNSFVELYNEGYQYYTTKDYDKALNLLLQAKKIASNDKEKIKVNKAILSSYQNIGNHEDDVIEILKELIKLEPSEYENYEQLISIYDSRDMTDEISELIDGISDVTVRSKLLDYSVAAPKFSDESGNYDKYISLKLTTVGSNKIYYTLDGSDPTTQSILYTEEINLNISGTITVKAIAVNEKGVASKVAENEYNIKPLVIEGPEVRPEGGTYTSPTMIEIDIPHGMKCYYTYGPEKEEPKVGENEFKEPIKMLRGKNIFSAIFVSDNGGKSDVTEVVYQLTINSVFNYDDALNVLKSYLENSGIAERRIVQIGGNVEIVDGEEVIVNPEDVITEEQFIKIENGNQFVFEYYCVTDIDNDEYYIINVREVNARGSTVDIIHYGVDTVSGRLETVENDPDNYGKFRLYVEEEESEETESQENN